MVLPHDLVSALAAAGKWPSQLQAGSMDSVDGWWHHMEHHRTWWCNHPAFQEKVHEPLCLYGDDAQLTKQGNEKITCITLSHCLDKRSSSMHTSWPLCLFRCVSCMHTYMHACSAHSNMFYSIRLCRLGMTPCKPIWPQCFGGNIPNVITCIC